MTMDLSRQDREAILKKVSHLVETKHFNPTLNGVDWKAALEARSARILQTDEPKAFEKEMQALVAELKTSHTGFGHRSALRIPARFSVNATFRLCKTEDGEQWVFQDVYEGGPAHLAGLEPGDLLLSVGDRHITSAEEPVFPMGETVRATVQKRDGRRILLQISVPKPKSGKRPITIPRAVSHSRLSDGIGLLKVCMFPGAVGIDVAKEISAAVAALSDCDRLIIDLRGNAGGGIGGLRLMGYLTPHRLPIGYSLTKKRATKGYKREELVQFTRIPDRKSALIWLLLRYAFIDKSIAIVTEGLGPQRFHGRIVVLTNQHTSSAGEMVAGFAKENNLANLVGTKTAGRLLSGSSFKVGHGYILGLPVAAYLTWQGALLEGTGVAPDHNVELPYEALKEGRDTQLEKAIEVVQSL